MAIAVVFAILLLVRFAGATPTLRLSTGSNTIVIRDGCALDSSAEAGVVAYFGGIDGFSITVGVAKPAIGNAFSPLMTLNEVTVVGGSGTLIIEFSENNFDSVYPSMLFTSIGGTTNSVVTYSVYSDSSNTLFGTSNLVTHQGPFTGNPSSSNSFGGPLSGGDAVGFLPAGSNFSLTQRVVIERGSGRDNTGFNATLSAAHVPDGGATVALLGISLVGLAGAMRFFGVRRARTGTED